MTEEFRLDRFPGLNIHWLVHSQKPGDIEALTESSQGRAKTEARHPQSIHCKKVLAHGCLALRMYGLQNMRCAGRNVWLFTGNFPIVSTTGDIANFKKTRFPTR